MHDISHGFDSTGVDVRSMSTKGGVNAGVRRRREGALGADGVEERPDLIRRMKHVHRHVRPATQHLRACVRRIRMAVAPDMPHTDPLVVQTADGGVLATLRHLANGLANSPH